MAESGLQNNVIIDFEEYRSKKFILTAPVTGNALPENSEQEVHMKRPFVLEDVQEIIDDISMGNAVIVDLISAEETAAQSIFDFLCGFCYIRHLSIQNISDKIFLFGYL